MLIVYAGAMTEGRMAAGRIAVRGTRLLAVSFLRSKYLLFMKALKAKACKLVNRSLVCHVS